VPATGIQFADFELDPARYELRRAGRTLKLEKIPMELLILLAALIINVYAQRLRATTAAVATE